MKELVKDLANIANAYRNTLIMDLRSATTPEAKEYIQHLINDVNSTLDEVNRKYKTNF
jgi:hypothetical protein